MHKRILLLAVALSTLFLGGQAVADEPANVERIKQFDVDITLSKENIAQVKEHIVYDFGANYKHGMYRDIPVDYVDGSDRYYLQFTYEGTNDEQGQTVQVQQLLRLPLRQMSLAKLGLHQGLRSERCEPRVWPQQAWPGQS